MEVASSVADQRSAQCRSARLIWAVMIVLFIYLIATYVVQLRSPLHVDMDSKRLLTMANSGAEGHNFRGPLPHNLGYDWFPIGYPAMLAGLEVAGLAKPWAYLGLNLVFAAVGVAGYAAAIRRAYGFSAIATLAVANLILLNFILLKYCCEIMTDVPFFGIAGVLIWLLVRAETSHGSRRWVLSLICLVLALASTQVRAVGVAFLPAVVWVVVGPSRHEHGTWGWIKAHRWLLIYLGLASVVVLALGFIFLVRPEYFNEFLGQYRQMGLGAAIANLVSCRASDLSAAVLNLPLSQTPEKLRPLFSILAFCGAGVSVFGCWRRRRIDVITIFSLTFVCILALVPISAPRYWLPLVPLILANFAIVAKDFGGRIWFRLAGAAYVLLYLVCALGGQVWETRLSWSGESFANRYHAMANIRATYRAAYSLDPDPDLTGLDFQTFYILRRYEPLAQRYLMNPTPASRPATSPSASQP